MNYYGLKSIIASGKNTFPMKVVSDSFCVAEKGERPYIEPAFSKVLFENEKPSVLLVSAVGATGKSILARMLSHETGLPLLNLGKHKPVADNTLTGLLTASFHFEDLSNIFLGIGNGSYGVIIDGIDEGRAKTTEKAFEAFLDDIVRLCTSPASTCFVLLGRSHIMEDCWTYLADKGINVGLITISPFSIENARKYIDTFTEVLEANYQQQYEEARDYILNQLSNAFEGGTKESEDGFLSFIGYPPVLDAIVTLLDEERNYYKLLEKIKKTEFGDVEITLLNRIVYYILQREKDQKVIPNILSPIVAELPKDYQARVMDNAFGIEEQCMRLVAFCLGRNISLKRIEEPLVNEKYEAQLITFLPEHPFIERGHFRNTIFESLALATLMVSSDPISIDLVLEYIRSHKYSYHLIYLLSSIVKSGQVPLRYLHIILGSALEFRSTNSTVQLHVACPEIDDPVDSTISSGPVEIEIEIFLGKNKDKSKEFVFNSDLNQATRVVLGCRLADAYISLPSEVILSDEQEVDLTAPVTISARKVVIDSKVLLLRRAAEDCNNDVVLEAKTFESTLEHITTNGITLTVSVSDASGIGYPCVQHVEKRSALPADPLLSQKYLRLKRILMEFRSHSRGSMARLKEKIENDRTLRNETGAAILRRMLTDGILTATGSRYYLHPEKIDKYLGISWSDLRRNRTSETLDVYLRSIV